MSSSASNQDPRPPTSAAEEVVLDLGGMRVTLADGLALQVSAAADGTVAGVALLAGESELRVQPCAAPRSGGSWEELRGQLLEYARSCGGEAQETEGALGREVHALLPGREVLGEDDSTLHPVRFVGMEGPRWLLRGVLTGPAARDASSARDLEEAFRALVVIRGEEALPPGAPLPLTPPAER